MAGVEESSVVGLADDKWGEKVVAAVVKKLDVNLGSGDILSHCKGHLHPWKCPKEIIFIAELPRNTMGKVLKEDVKQLFYETPAESPAIYGGDECEKC